MAPHGDDPLADLRQALEHSPDNVPLRRHVGDLLLKRGLLEDAERTFREGLAGAPESEELKFGLARAFHALGKRSEATVLVEDLIARPQTAPGVYLLHARLLLRTGDLDEARSAYRRAIEADPELADADLADAVGHAGSYPEADERSEVDPEGRVRLRGGDGDGDDLEIEIERPEIDFSQVGGMDDLKSEIRLKIIEPLANPEIYAAYGKAIGGGILMYGPPGCGKTHLARATAGEVDASFLAIGIHDVLDMWFGNSEAHLHSIFETARDASPCVLFFDEIDAIGASRRDMRRSPGRHLVNQLLAELDGSGRSNDGVLVLAATNAPWHLDEALRRPGRFDRILFVPPPDTAARASILEILLRGKPADGVDLEKIADRTRDFSGADLMAVVDRAIEDKLKIALAKGVPEPLTTKDLLKASKALRPSTKEWFASARNHALYANEGGLYDDILRYLKITK